MNFVSMQLLGGDWFSGIISVLFLIVIITLYPRIMISQIMWKLEKVTRELELMSNTSKKFIAKEISKKPSKTLRNSINRFYEFFIISPTSLDPYGIVKKIEHVVQGEKSRFEYFVNQAAPKVNAEKKACLGMGLGAGMSLYQIAKILRHYIEIVKKTKNFQIAMILQMQLPFIEKIAKALFKGTRALTMGEPIGDAVGPFIATNLAGNKKSKEVEEDTLLTKTKMFGREIFIIRAKGPGGRLGRPGLAVEKLVKKQKIKKVITIDAAGKLEGEKTGSVAEGVGVAIGGPGVEKTYIENIAIKKNIPLDSIVIKMQPEEAIMPMRKPVKDSLPEVKKAIERSIKRSTKSKDKIIIVGVGNSSGVGNSIKDLKKVIEFVEKYERKLKKEKKKKKRWF